MLQRVDASDAARLNRKVVSSGVAAADGRVAEMVYDPVARATGFAVWDGSSVTYEKTFKATDSCTYVPYSPENNLVKNRVVLFPSEAAEYGTEEELVGELRTFIHRYVDLSPHMERIAAYYALFTWVYDDFNELPYFRFRGDYGSGKTRALLTIGSLCYKPIFASGASTVSPIFRLLDLFRGTLVVDEGDFRVSDEKAELVKIFNNGNARGFPVLRVEQTSNRKEFSPVAYSVFGPKLLASRGYFQDRALESRFLTEEMGHARLRSDIPINLPGAHEAEATALRNKLLLFRFRNRRKVRTDPVVLDAAFEPRLNQVLSPLVTIIQDNGVRDDLKLIARQYQEAAAMERGMDTEAQILEVLRRLFEVTPRGAGISIKAIADAFAVQYGAEHDRKITPHWIGHIVRRRLGLHTERRRGIFVLVVDSQRLCHLFEKYGVLPQAGDLGDSGDLPTAYVGRSLSDDVAVST